MALPDEHWDPDAPGEGDTLFGLPHTPEEAAVVVIPVPWEATCSYRLGTAGAPGAILAASQQVDLLDLETGEPWRRGIALDEVHAELVAWSQEATALARPIVEAGGPQDEEQVALCRRVGALAARRDDLVGQRVAQLLSQGRIPAVLGGEHSVPLGAIQAAAERSRGLGILHIDAHADLRVAYEGFVSSHASIMHRVGQLFDVQRVVQVGVRDLGHRELARLESDGLFEAWTDPRLADAQGRGATWHSLCRQIVASLPRDVWISFDIDGLDPSLCPHTGTPVPGGLSWHQATQLLATLAQSARRIVGFDLCEVAPQPWDADVGARLLYKLAGWAIATNPEDSP